VYRCVEVVALDLARPLPHIESDLPLEIRRLLAEEVPAYARFRGRDVEGVPGRGRLERGDMCVCAWLDGEIVAASWLAFESAWIDEIGRGVRLARDEAYVYDSFTTESRRGAGIAAFRARWTAEHLRLQGYRRIVGWISLQNRPALGPARKLGYASLGQAGFVRMWPWRRDFVAPEGGARRWAARDTPIVVERDFCARAGA
jgi:GNAT superfamily N-acetyltransferase